jgi:hypothetical protein
MQFLADFKEHGAAALVKVRQERPADYWRIATQLLPQQVLVNAFVRQEDAGVLADVDPAMKRQIAQRIMAELAAERAKQIDAEVLEEHVSNASKPSQDKDNPQGWAGPVSRG